MNWYCPLNLVSVKFVLKKKTQSNNHCFGDRGMIDTCLTGRLKTELDTRRSSLEEHFGHKIVHQKEFQWEVGSLASQSQWTCRDAHGNTWKIKFSKKTIKLWKSLFIYWNIHDIYAKMLSFQKWNAMQNYKIFEVFFFAGLASGQLSYKVLKWHCDMYTLFLISFVNFKKKGMNWTGP